MQNEVPMAEKEEICFKKLLSIMNREQKNIMRKYAESIRDNIDKTHDSSDVKKDERRRKDEDPEKEE